ncbi:MAG: hypothetical protein P8L72_06370 [Flavobacteriaceae bacterium]|nr:hypothetical protein [Flavobacteriaceae bacterium]
MKIKIGFIGVLLIAACEYAPNSKKELIDFIPPNPLVIVKTTDLASVQSQMSNTHFLEELSLFFKELIPKKLPNSHHDPAVISYHSVGKNQLEYVLIRQFEVDTVTPFERDSVYYNKQLIEKLAIKEDVVYQTQLEGIQLLSPSQLLIENSIRTHTKNRALLSENFNKLYQTNDSSFSLLIHEDFSSYASSKFVKAPLLFNELSDWSLLEVQLSPEGVYGNGAAILQDSLPRKINLLKNIPPTAFETDAVIPEQSQSFQSYSFSYDAYVDNLNTYEFAQNQGLSEVDSLWIHTAEISAIHSANATAFAVRFTSTESAKKYLQQFDFSKDTYRDYELQSLTNDSISIPFFDNMFSKHMAFIDNILVASADKNAVESLITHFQNGTTLNKSASFEAIKKQLPEENSFVLMGLQPEFQNRLVSQLSEALQKPIKAADFSKTPYFIMQGTLEQGVAHLYFSLRKALPKSKENQKVSQRFSYTLEAPIAMQPQSVVNHRTKEKEWVVQDQNHALYLISHQGKLIWKKQLSGAIQGPIYQVDLYKNGRLQLAFTTEKEFLVLDRNGKEVRGFGKSFKKGTPPLPLAVFDYDQSRNYRLLLTQDNRIQMFDRKMKAVRGFSKTKTKKPVLFAPKHFRIGSRDYIVLGSRNAPLEILNRKGAVRIANKKNIQLFENDIYVHKNRFTTIDAKQQLIQMSTQGKVYKTTLPLETPYMMDANNQTLAMLSENLLTINGQTVELEFGAYTAPKIFVIHNKTYVAVTDRQAKKVYLYDANAQLLPNFPVYGSHAVSMTAASSKGGVRFAVQGDSDNMLVYAF